MISLYILFFLIGFIIDFSETSELTWLQTFSILIGQIIIGVNSLSWGVVRVQFGYFSDRSKYSRYKQCLIVSVIPFIAWVIIAIGFDSISIILCLLAIEMSFAAINTIIESVMVIESNRENDLSIVAKCHRAKLIGKMIANGLGGIILSKSGSIRLIFWLQTICVGGLFCFLLLLSYRSVTYEVVITTDEDDVSPIEDGVSPIEGGVSPIEGGVSTIEDVVDKDTSSPIKPTLSTSLILFVTLFSSVPLGYSPLFYFMFGPLEITAADIGLIESITAFTSIICTFIAPRYVGTKIQWICYVVSVLLVLVHLGRYICVSRLTVMDGYSTQNIDFYLLLLTFILYETADGLIWLTYASRSSANAKAGEEAKSYAYYITLPTFGKFIRIGIDSILTNELHVDHDQYGLYPDYLTICVYCSLLCVIFTVFIK